MLLIALIRGVLVVLPIVFIFITIQVLNSFSFINSNTCLFLFNPNGFYKLVTADQLQKTIIQCYCDEIIINIRIKLKIRINSVSDIVIKCKFNRHITQVV